MGDPNDIIDRLCAAVEDDEPPRRALLVSAAAEIERLRFAIRRLADQDATLSVCDGNVTVTMDGTLTAAEREELLEVMDFYDAKSYGKCSVFLRGLLDRFK